jgi:hypothetical protein
MKTILCFFVLMVGICLISGCNSPMSQKPNLVFKDLKITKSVSSRPTELPSFLPFNPQCIVELNGYVKNEGNKEATGYYVICDYYNGEEHLAQDGRVPYNFEEKNLYVGADDKFNFNQYFNDPNICDTLKVDCKAYCKEC